MLRSPFWIDQMSRMIYVAILILSWFQALYLVYPRLHLSEFPDWGVLWLLLVVGSYSVIIPYIPNHLHTLCFWLVSFIGIFTGNLLLNDLIISSILTLTLSTLAFRAAVNQIGTKEIITLWMTSLSFFGFLLFFINGFGRLSEDEVSHLVFFFVITLVLVLLGVSITQLNYVDTQKTIKDVMKQWKNFNLWVWGSIPILFIISVFIVIGSFILYLLFRWLIIAAISPIAKWVFTDLYDWIRMLIESLMSKMNVFDFHEMFEEETSEIDSELVSEQESAFLDIVLAIILIILITSAIYLIIRYIKRHSKHIVKMTSMGNGQLLEMESKQVDEKIKDKFHLKNIFPSWFFNRNGDSLHEVRKDFRDLLKLLREKGYYMNNNMTVQQINRMVQELRMPSDLYERLRYGDENLTDEEIQFFKVEIKRIKKELLNK